MVGNLLSKMLSQGLGDHRHMLHIGVLSIKDATNSRGFYRIAPIKTRGARIGREGDKGKITGMMEY